MIPPALLPGQAGDQILYRPSQPLPPGKLSAILPVNCFPSELRRCASLGGYISQILYLSTYPIRSVPYFQRVSAECLAFYIIRHDHHIAGSLAWQDKEIEDGTSLRLTFPTPAAGESSPPCLPITSQILKMRAPLSLFTDLAVACRRS